MSIESFKHKNSKRAHIPSKEEAGYEDTNAIVREKTLYEIPKCGIIERGADPELVWKDKYGKDDLEDRLKIDIRSLYRHEHISPEVLIEKLYSKKEITPDQLSLNDLFGNALEIEEVKKISEYYKHQDGWSNRLIQGDSLLVMTSLLEREGMAGKVQMIYFDPPYGIKYGSNWQIKMNNRDVKDGSDESLSGEPEQIKAFRDTWELGIHSYLSYLRDRLLVAKELLTESGSCFVQISDENVHLVRNIMDEVFGSENFVSLIVFEKTRSQTSDLLAPVCDFIIWYAKNADQVKYRQLYQEKEFGGEGTSQYKYIESPDKKTTRTMTKEELDDSSLIPKNWKIFSASPVVSESGNASSADPIEFQGKNFTVSKGSWKTNKDGFERLKKLNRLLAFGNTLMYKRYYQDFPFLPRTNVWDDAYMTGFSEDKLYVVQTSIKAIQRCLLMTSDPGDLVLDPTCGSGTTSYVAEQWGRRWITIDTSRIAVNVAKSRITTATFPYYNLYDEKNGDIRNGFIYKKVPHITLKSLANDEPAEDETLFDQPEVDKKKLRVAGPFTVETLQNYEPLSPEELESTTPEMGELENFEQQVFERLKSSGINTGDKKQHTKFIRIEPLSSSVLHAEGFYKTAKGESKAYIHVGPKFGTVSKRQVSEAIVEFRNRGGADWLIILGFSFESNIESKEETASFGSFTVTKVRMHDDFLQEGLLKKPSKSSGSFVSIGEPDIKLHKKGKEATIEIRGLDIYDPIKDEVNARNVNDIAYWMVDDDYDGSNFVVKQIFFCGGDKDEFDKWKKGLSELAKQSIKLKAEKTLKIEIDEEAFDRIYGHKSHPIEIKRTGQKVAVRVISQFGEESTKVMEV